MAVKKYVKRAFCGGLTAFLLWGFTNTAFSLFKNLQKVNLYQNMSYIEVISEVKTPEETEWHIRNYIKPRFKKRVDSFKILHQNRLGDCSEATVAAAALLSDDGYEPYYLEMMKPGSEAGHAVFVYKKNQNYGSIGINICDKLKPGNEILDESVKKLGYERYYFGRIGPGLIPDWISTDRDLALTYEEVLMLVLKIGSRITKKWNKAHKNLRQTTMFIFERCF